MTALPRQAGTLDLLLFEGRGYMWLGGSLALPSQFVWVCVQCLSVFFCFFYFTILILLTAFYFLLGAQLFYWAFVDYFSVGVADAYRHRLTCRFALMTGRTAGSSLPAGSADRLSTFFVRRNSMADSVVVGDLPSNRRVGSYNARASAVADCPCHPLCHPGLMVLLNIALCIARNLI